ncbi:hypothetical protein AX760_13635 [Pararhizobium antarcticum]|uniref:Uncharacterized protein n=1 Tax=Pararhizobium antarcticum TaxID=1798805 RepID=A0A657LVB6_9HYPH|nr:hypothetical protein AX761_23170 [Rhizobium sp. 58]OJF99249.1 hypothetical protein AX760_13635 [Pararhizobium antarcticum]
MSEIATDTTIRVIQVPKPFERIAFLISYWFQFVRMQSRASQIFPEWIIDRCRRIEVIRTEVDLVVFKFGCVL